MAIIHDVKELDRMDQMSPLKIIRTYFEAQPHGAKVTVPEVKELSAEDRLELATLAAAELGVEVAPPKGPSV